MRVLLLATRQPHGRQSGRKSVLRTIIRACEALGHDVRVVAITDEGPPDGDGRVETLAPPRVGRVVANVLVHSSRGRLCLNECLYASPAINRAVAEICDTWGADVVIADMLRTSSIALATGRRVVVDLDDLLSRRYRDLAKGRAESSTVLGYYGHSLPRPVRGLLSAIAARLVGVEARLVERRERTVARAADVVSLVAEAEAAAFEAQIGRDVAWLPMAVEIPPNPAPVASNPKHRVVFVGGLDYHANLEAVRAYVRDVAPALRASGGEAVRLRVVGHCPPAVVDELGGEASVELVGYVDDLSAELSAARAFVAPIPPGTGVKTKVLEAMAAGVPVVSTPHGVNGIGVRDREHCLVGSDGEALADAVLLLARDADRAASIGLAGRRLVEAQYAVPVITARWRTVLEAIEGRGEAR